MKELTYNVLPSPTWRWLKMNGVRAALTCPENAPELALEGALAFGPAPEKVPEGSAGPEFSAFLQESGVSLRSFILPDEAEGLLRLDLCNGAARVHVHAGRGSRLTVIAKILPGTVQSLLEVTTAADEGAHVTLVTLCDAGDGEAYLSLGTEAMDSAQIEIIQMSLSGRHVAMGAWPELSGTRASLDAHIAYLAEGDHTLDMNWTVPHLAPRTESSIACQGVLQGTAKKIFRGTIDFRPGSAGAKGAENEDVLLLSPNVHNQTLPVILCAEEDVAGNHGASIGRLSEDMLFYLSSRGLSEPDIYEMLSRCRLSACGARIPDEKTKAWLSARLGEEN